MRINPITISIGNPPEIDMEMGEVQVVQPTKWEQIQDKPFEEIGEGLEVDDGKLKVTSIGVSNWEDIQDKPFESLNSHDFSVVNNELKVNTTNEADPDNTLPITSAGTYVIVGNIDTLLQTI